MEPKITKKNLDDLLQSLCKGPPADQIIYNGKLRKRGTPEWDEMITEMKELVDE